ncbi:MAG: hypothetical protein MRY74_06400 [Neomegalonema sp.]|nr:hypothetical protein [Neomegalonema sp.]
MTEQAKQNGHQPAPGAADEFEPEAEGALLEAADDEASDNAEIALETASEPSSLSMMADDPAEADTSGDAAPPAAMDDDPPAIADPASASISAEDPALDALGHDEEAGDGALTTENVDDAAISTPEAAAAPDLDDEGGSHPIEAQELGRDAQGAALEDTEQADHAALSAEPETPPTLSEDDLLAEEAEKLLAQAGSTGDPFAVPPSTNEFQNTADVAAAHADAAEPPEIAPDALEDTEALSAEEFTPPEEFAPPVEASGDPDILASLPESPTLDPEAPEEAAAAPELEAAGLDLGAMAVKIDDPDPNASDDDDQDDSDRGEDAAKPKPSRRVRLMRYAAMVAAPLILLASAGYYFFGGAPYPADGALHTTFKGCDAAGNCASFTLFAPGFAYGWREGKATPRPTGPDHKPFADRIGSRLYFAESVVAVGLAEPGFASKEAKAAKTEPIDWIKTADVQAKHSRADLDVKTRSHGDYGHARASKTTATAPPKPKIGLGGAATPRALAACRAKTLESMLAATKHSVESKAKIYRASLGVLKPAKAKKLKMAKGGAPLLVIFIRHAHKDVDLADALRRGAQRHLKPALTKIAPEMAVRLSFKNYSCWGEAFALTAKKQKTTDLCHPEPLDCAHFTK